MKPTKGIFFVIFSFVILIVIIAFTGLGPIKGTDEIRYGIDIRGGVEVIFVPKDFDGVPSAEELARVEGYIADAKKLQTQANLKTEGHYKASEEYDSTMMPDVMEQYFKDNDIEYDDRGVSARQNGSEWQRAINSLEDRKAALEVSAYMDAHGLAYGTGSSKDDLDVAIQSLQAHQETLGTDI